MLDLSYLNRVNNDQIRYSLLPSWNSTKLVKIVLQKMMLCTSISFCDEINFCGFSFATVSISNIKGLIRYLLFLLKSWIEFTDLHRLFYRMWYSALPICHGLYILRIFSEWKQATQVLNERLSPKSNSTMCKRRSDLTAWKCIANL